MKWRSRSTLFLMEQLIAIAVFAICAAVCVKILFVAHQKTVDAVDTRYALIIAENAAEIFKASDDVLPTQEYNEALVGKSFYIIKQSIRETEAVVFLDISIERIADSKELISFTAARRNTQ